MSVDSGVCYDCGRRLSGDMRIVSTYLWQSSFGAEHWGEIKVCPACARRRALLEGAPLAVLLIAAAGAAFAVGWQFLP
jgi:hypothetical protein